MASVQIKVDGTIEQVHKFDLKSLQSLVGGYIEVIKTNDDRLMVLNEEGKLDGLAVNTTADILARGIVADDDHIVGDVVIIGKEDEEKMV